MAAYGQMERVRPSHGYHCRMHEQDFEQTSQTRPLQPLPHTFPHLTLFTPTLPTPSYLDVPCLRRGTNWDKRLGQTEVGPYEGGVRVAPPTLLKHTSRESRCKEGVRQGGIGIGRFSLVWCGAVHTFNAVF